MVDTTTTGKTQPASSGRPLVSRESLQLATRRPAGRQPVVLLAEDDARVREAIRLLIEMQGCTVIEAADGWQAAAFASAYSGPIDLLVSDAVMPGMTGPAVYDLVRRQRPDLPAIFVSGHPQDAVFPGGVLPPAAEFLHKPFTPQDFARAFATLVPGVALGPRRVA
jgi:two-component system, cell cycle sensor histidine kinase and response regulator CckA